MRLSRPAVAAVLSSALVAACETVGGLTVGSNGYLQYYIEGVVVYEYGVPNGGAPCAQNAALNNRERGPDAKGSYRCSSDPAPAAALPYSFVSVSKLGRLQGFRDTHPTATRFASRDACRASVEELERNNIQLISDNCDGDAPPPKARPGETRA